MKKKFRVQEILDVKKHYEKTQFLINTKGYIN